MIHKAGIQVEFMKYLNAEMYIKYITTRYMYFPGYDSVYDGTTSVIPASYQVIKLMVGITDDDVA